jgi:hypothetical protein
MRSVRQRSEIPLVGVVLATAFVSTSCKQDDEDEKLGDMGQLVLEFVDVLGQSTEFYCECAVEAGYYDSVELCWQPAVPPPMADCIARVMDDFDEAAGYFECSIAAQEEYVACLEDIGCGGDTYACYMLIVDPCPPIPYAAEQEVSKQCYGVTMPDPFNCADGTQIPETYQCDGESDCADDSDEQNCPTFTCDEGTEVPLHQQCNGFSECPDFSDELNCPGQFVCSDGAVIPLSWQCDGFQDCADNGDEQGC